ncbi:CYTH domain-containing protein [Clostridiaceae bacterium M8S5]|nr:CYTH domain-containing protein [Clostridiaceae bacterium M8S5]
MYLEKELKYLISAKDYKILRTYLKNNHIKEESIEQINYYIDSYNNIMNKSKMSSRIRKIGDGKFEFTIKRKLKYEGSNIHIKEEYNKKITYEEMMEIKASRDIFNIPAIKKFINENINNFNINECVMVIGELKTVRELYKFDEFDTIIIDKSTYLDNVDYEIEVEADELCKDKFDNFLHELEITPFDDSLSKTDRFLTHLKMKK